MKQYDVEDAIISCILQKNDLINELIVDLKCFKNNTNRRMVLFLKRIYGQYKQLDLTLMISKFKTDTDKNRFIEYYMRLFELVPSTSLFYEYQQELMDQYKDEEIREEIQKYEASEITINELIENINKKQNETAFIKNQNKKTPEEMLSMIRNQQKNIIFDRFHDLNKKLNIKKKTINVIAARPSEGKSALALNLFCDLAKKYKCLYFNMEMTEEEVYERMLGIESDIPIAYINKPETEYQNKNIVETANKIYTYKYEVINGSKTVQAIKNKIVKEQREEHTIVFIDYTGYIVGRKNQNDRERVGEAVRELNNITKDYDCTIFLIAQINRNGSETPTMQDLKDSGELEQTADTIIIIHDDDKKNNDDVKEIGLLIPKCRGGRRQIRIPIKFHKPKQRMEM